MMKTQIRRRVVRALGPAQIGILITTGVLPELLGGTVITTNLPTNTGIINIDARADGAASFNGDQSLWYHPFNTSGTLLEYPIPSGTYSFRVVNPADAERLFPSLTAQQTNQIYSAWTYNSPWILNYLVFASAAATNYSIPQLFDGDPEWPPYGNATDAYNGSIAHGTYDQIRVGPLGRASTNITYSYTFTNNTTLIFAVPDYGLYDNAGGVSVLVAPASLPPVLTILPGNGSATLQWATNAEGFLLAQTTNVQASAWRDVTNLNTVQGGNYSLTLPLDSATRFFRLHKP